MIAPRIVVVGAGVFGSWTAWLLAKSGAQVALVDAWGPANARSSSGDESRIIRGAYARKAHYVKMTDRSFTLWESLEKVSGVEVVRRAGAIWLFGDDDAHVRDCLPHLASWNFPIERLDLGVAAQRYPQVNWSDVKIAYYESRAGWLLARRSVHEVVAQFKRAGGTLRLATAQPEMNAENGRLRGVRLGDGSLLEADRYVFACGPWLRTLFPDWLGSSLLPSRQEVFYFGPPPGNTSFNDSTLPVWLDNARGSWYGIPASEHHGFKISCNDLGEVVDPSTLNRTPDAGRLARAREHLAFRFPAMKDAPLVESRVCQYENTPDRDLIMDHFPNDSRVVIVGGGSGHGFKLAPALGEMTAEVALGRMEPPELYRIRRFKA